MLAELVLLRLARGADLCATIAIFGALLFQVSIARAALRAHPAAAGAYRSTLVRALRLGLALKLASAAAWLPLQALQMLEGVDAAGLPAFTVQIATQTNFGQALLARTALIVAAVWLAGDLGSRVRAIAAMAAALAALGLQAQLGHAAATDDFWLPVLVAIHVVAAGAWLGSLLPLALLIAAAPPAAALTAARRYSWLGLAAVTLLIASAWFQSPALIGNVGGWFGTSYGLVALGKTLGFGLLLAIAAGNRFVFTRRLADRGTARGLLVSIALESGVGLAVLALAVLLATLPPGTHVQAVWPFPLRPDVSQIGDAYVRKEIWRAAMLAAVALAGVATLFRRRLRLVGPVLAVALLAWLPHPNLRLFALPAYPTSYYRSETGFSVASIARGATLVKQHCLPTCFKAQDDPTDMATYNLWGRPDGDFFTWIVEIFDTIGYSPFPHGTIRGLGERDRWLLIDYFRARVAGSAVRQSGQWRSPIPAPALLVSCLDGPAELGSLPGVVQVIATDGTRPVELPAPPPGIGLTTIVLAKNEAAKPIAANLCFSSSPDAWTALAIMGSVDEADLAGTSFLIDANGLLRFRFRADAAPAPEAWRRHVADIAAAPFQRSRIGTHLH